MYLKSIFYFPALEYTHSFVLIRFLSDFQLWLIFLLDQKIIATTNSRMKLSTSHVYCFHFTRMLVALQCVPHIFYTIQTLILFLCSIFCCATHNNSLRFIHSEYVWLNVQKAILTCFALIELVVGIGEKECLQLKRKRAKSQHGKSKEERNSFFLRKK